MGNVRAREGQVSANGQAGGALPPPMLELVRAAGAIVGGAGPARQAEVDAIERRPGAAKGAGKPNRQPALLGALKAPRQAALKQKPVELQAREPKAAPKGVSVADFPPEVIDVKLPRTTPLGFAKELARRLEERRGPKSPYTIHEEAGAILNGMKRAELCRLTTFAPSRQALRDQLADGLKAAGVDGAGLAADKVVDLMASNLVHDLIFAPVQENALAEAAALRRTLERQGQDGSSATAIATLEGLEAALTNLPVKRGRVDMVAIGGDMARRFADTELVGLRSADFPFDDVTPKNAAQELIADELDAWDRSEEGYFLAAGGAVATVLTGGADLPLMAIGVGAATGVPDLAMGVANVEGRRAMALLGYTRVADVERDEWLVAGAFVLGLLPIEAGSSALRSHFTHFWFTADRQAIDAAVELAVALGSAAGEVAAYEAAVVPNEALSEGERACLQRAWQSLGLMRGDLLRTFEEHGGRGEAAFERCLQAFAFILSEAIVTMPSERVQEEFETFCKKVLVEGRARR